MKDTVKQLTKETSEEGVTRKQSKNNGIGMKNKKLQGEINKILGEMNQNSEGVSPGVTGTNTLGEQTHSGDLNSYGSNKDTENRFNNLPLAETIRKLQAGSEGGAGVYKVETVVGDSNSDSDAPGVCGGLWFNCGEAISHVWGIRGGRKG